MLQALLGGRTSDLDVWAALLAPDAHLRIGNAAPAIGREEALRDLAVLLAGAEGMGHAFAHCVRVGDLVVVETDIVCRAGGAARAAVIPCAVLARVGDGLLKDVRFYLDPSPLGSAAHPAAGAPA